ncbi:hypothetical protein HKX48_000163 [Thoreauomyces humboldtii]|nr:hypothetical protein HKX48_000163 [Thoreauomyces humboldtii]
MDQRTPRDSSEQQEQDPLLGPAPERSPRSEPANTSSPSFRSRIVHGKHRRAFAVLCFFLLIVWGSIAIATHYPNRTGGRPDGRPDTGRTYPGAATGRNGVVSSENPLCSAIGLDVLKDGGSAVDAMIAASVCTGVTNMYSSGIGGGGFAVVRGTKGESEFVDFRETAPAAASVDMYKDDPLRARFGGLGVGVPGEIRGFETLYNRHGKLPWKRLFEPSVRLAIDGWEVSPVLAQRISLAPDLILNNTAFRHVFAPKGRLLVAGDRIKRVNYGKTLHEIGEKGASVFYEGWIAKSLVQTVEADGGILTMKDMRNYAVNVEPALVGFYHGKRVITSPPPTRYELEKQSHSVKAPPDSSTNSGAVLLSILNIMEGYDLQDEGRTGTNIHRLVEAYKHAFAQRSFYGDPTDTIYRNISEIARNFTTKSTAHDIRKRISDDKTYPIDHYEPHFSAVEDHGTMHVSVLTASGEAVSATCTVNLLFGGQIMDAETGIILNDEMDDFSIPGIPNAFGLIPSPYNYVQPNKRPLSSSSPVIIEDGATSSVQAVVGASGGSLIITSVAQAVLDIMSWDAEASTAVKEARAHHQLLPDSVLVEHEFDGKLVQELRERGHDVVVFPEGFTITGVEAITRGKDGLLEGASDWRKGGVAAAY